MRTTSMLLATCAKERPSFPVGQGDLAMDEHDDQRSSKRRRTVLTGKVLFNNRASVFDCTVRDLSDTGARITLADVSVLPRI